MFDGGAGPEAIRRTAERRRVVADAFGAALGRYGARACSKYCADNVRWFSYIDPW